MRLPALSLTIASLLLVACGSQTVPMGAPHIEDALRGSAPVGSSAHLYVSNYYGGTVTIYDLPDGNLLQKITVPTSNLVGLAVGSSGNVYVANQAVSAVDVYASGTSTLRQSITAGMNAPGAVALDSADRLYVANFAGPPNHLDGSVTIYARDRNSVLKLITDGICSPSAFAFSAAGDLYVANEFCGPKGVGSVTEYRRGSFALMRTITQGVAAPRSLAVDRHGSLYVANYAYPFDGGGTVTVYAPGKTTPLRTIPSGQTTDQCLPHQPGFTCSPYAVALDKSENVYVANNALAAAQGTVTVFRPGSTTAQRVITSGIYYPEALGFDHAGNLYVVNDACSDCKTRDSIGWISQYAAGKSKPTREIRAGLGTPSSIVIASP